jgi:hypothetical protein
MLLCFVFCFNQQALLPIMSSSPRDQFFLCPPPAISYLPHKSHGLYRDMDKAAEAIKESLTNSGHCREEPHCMNRQTKTTMFFPIIEAIPVNSKELFKVLEQIEPRAKFDIVSHAEQLCPDIRARGTVAIIMTMEHTAFGEKEQEKGKEEEAEEPHHQWRQFVGMACALLVGAFLFWAFFK